MTVLLRSSGGNWIPVGALSLHERTPMGTLALCGAFGVVGTLTMLYSVSISATVFLIGGFFYGLAYSTNTVQSALIRRKICGQRDFPQIYAAVIVIYAIATATGQSLWGFIADKNGGDSPSPFGFVAALCIIFSIASM